MINVKDFDSNLQKIVQKHWHLQQWINCNKKNENINSVNPLYLIIFKPDGNDILKETLEASIQFLLLQMAIKKN